jgi:hypothetical protein
VFGGKEGEIFMFWHSMYFLNDNFGNLFFVEFLYHHFYDIGVYM